MAYLYFDVEYAIKTHDKILEISGGMCGVINMGILESILQHIQNDDYYYEYESKLTHLVYSVNKNHCFNDGNKRTSIALGAFFLEINGLDVYVTKFIREMENIAVAVANNLIDKDLLHEVVYSLINDEEYDEYLKLKIIQALSANE